MSLTRFVRSLETAKRDRKRSNYRESLELSAGRRVVLESKSERDWWETFIEELKNGGINLDRDYSVRQLFEALVPDGREMVESWNPRNGPSSAREMIEAAGAVASSDFSNINGQIIYTAMMEDLTPEELPFQNLIPTQSTPYDGEKIPGVAGLGDQAEVVAELENYPLVGTTEDWIETPQTVKRGFIVPITKEAIFFDRTGGMVLAKARAVGESLRLNKEKRAIDCIIDENTTAHQYKWRGTTYDTYQTASPWDNVTAGNALVDWTDIDNADQTLNGITDPNTGEPVVVEADTLICTKANEKTAMRIANATEITVTTPGYATSSNPTETRQANPYGGAFTVLSTRLLAARMATDTTWYYGNPRKMAKYMENWPITVVEAPANNSDDFNMDIVSKFKCSERGTYVVVEPRVVTKCTVA